MTISLNPSITRCAVYLRSATGDRASLLWQEEACRAAAARQNPAWHIDDDLIFTDTAMSGLSHDRPGLNALLQTAAQRPRPFDYVIIEAWDRLGRDLAAILHLVEILKFHDISVYIASLDRDLRSQNIHDLVVFSQWHNYQIDRLHGERVSCCQLNAFLHGNSVGGRCYGFRSYPVYRDSVKPGTSSATRLTVVEDDAAVVRRIFGDFADGLSAGEISRRLNADGVPDPRRTGWNAGSIRRILRSGRYRGTVEWSRTRRLHNPVTGGLEVRSRLAAEIVKIAMPHVRIVDDDLAARVDARLRRSSKS